ncbi:MAG: hypothetical protein AABX39_06325 [Nanoarchaeota archaeon]
METIAVPKAFFGKILDDVEVLIDDVETALDEKVKQRILEVESGKVKGKTEKEYKEYLAKRGIKSE